MTDINNQESICFHEENMLLSIRIKGKMMEENKKHTFRNNELNSEHNHEHTHPHSDTKIVLNRLAKATGHLKSVSKMIENGKDCSEILIQLSAVISALNRTGKIILEDHIEHCIVDAVKSGDNEAIENLKYAIDKFVK